MNDHDMPLSAYLASELDPARRATVEQHLVGCDRCWREVHLGRLGQAAAIRASEPVPVDLRDRIVATLAAPPALASSSRREAGSAPRHELSRRLILRSAAAAALLAGSAFGAGALVERASDHRGPAQVTTTASDRSGTIQAAVNCYRMAVLSGTGVPTEPPPDLTALGLHVIAGSKGLLAGQPANLFVYQNAPGQDQIYIFLSQAPFGQGTGAERSDATSTIDGLIVFSADTPPMIIVGANPTLVTNIGQRLT